MTTEEMLKELLQSQKFSLSCDEGNLLYSSSTGLPVKRVSNNPWEIEFSSEVFRNDCFESIQVTLRGFDVDILVARAYERLVSLRT